LKPMKLLAAAELISFINVTLSDANTTEMRINKRGVSIYFGRRRVIKNVPPDRLRAEWDRFVASIHEEAGK